MSKYHMYKGWHLIGQDHDSISVHSIQFQVQHFNQPLQQDSQLFYNVNHLSVTRSRHLGIRQQKLLGLEHRFVICRTVGDCLSLVRDCNLYPAVFGVAMLRSTSVVWTVHLDPCSVQHVVWDFLCASSCHALCIHLSCFVHPCITVCGPPQKCIKSI